MSKGQLFYPTSQKLWTAVNWKKAERSVIYLQKRIMKASQKNQKRQVRNLQRLLIRSLSARLKAVKQVTEEILFSQNVQFDEYSKLNQVLALRQRRNKFLLQPIQTKFIKTKKNVFDFSQIKDKIYKVLWYFTLLPLLDNNSDQNNSNFYLPDNPKNLYADIKTIFTNKTPVKWVLKLNFQPFFEKINVKSFSKAIPMEKKVLSKWFKAKFYKDLNSSIDNKIFFDKNENKNLLFLLINLTLKSLNFSLKNKRLEFKKQVLNNPFFSFLYFDYNCLITFSTKKELEIYKNFIFSFFNKNGIFINEDQMSIIEMVNGVHFGNWNFSYLKKSYFFINISRKSLKFHKNEIKQFIKQSKNLSLLIFILKLSEKIIYWKKENDVANNFIKISGELEKYIFRLLWKWARKRHGKKTHSWIFNNYWLKINGKNFFNMRDKKSKKIYQLSSY